MIAIGMTEATVIEEADIVQTRKVGIEVVPGTIVRAAEEVDIVIRPIFFSTFVTQYALRTFEAMRFVRHLSTVECSLACLVLVQLTSHII